MSEEEKKFIKAASRNGLTISFLHLVLIIVPFAIYPALYGTSFYSSLAHSGQLAVILIPALISVLLCATTILLFCFAGSRKSFSKAYPLVLSGFLSSYLISIQAIVSFASTIVSWNQYFSSGNYNGYGWMYDLQDSLVSFVLFLSLLTLNTVFLVSFLTEKKFLRLPVISDAVSESEQKNQKKAETQFKKIRIEGLVVFLAHLGFLCVMLSLNYVEAARDSFHFAIYEVFRILLPRLPDISVCLLCLVMAFMAKPPMKTNNRKTLLLGGFFIYLLLFFWELTSFFYFGPFHSYYMIYNTALPSIILIVVYAGFFSWFLYKTKAPRIKEGAHDKALLAGDANEQLQIAINAHDFRKAEKIQKQIDSLSAVTPSGTRSYFDGHLIQLLGWNLLCLTVDAVTLGFCVPFTICWKLQWESKHTVLNGKRLSFDGNGLQLLGKWVLWLLLSLITVGIYGFFLIIKLKQWKVSHTHLTDLA